MAFDAKKGICICERCGNCWRSSRLDADLKDFIEPRSCAKCKNIGWNKPRTYAGKYVPVVMAKRFKKTGRAAKKKIKMPSNKFVKTTGYGC